METSSDIGWTRALAGLDDNEVRRIERCLGVREVPARTPIFHQGDPAGELFIVRSGRVRLIRRMESGEEFTSGV
jgi:CRP-like cAMP-binding protein